MSLLKKKIKLVKEVLHATEKKNQADENCKKDFNGEDDISSLSEEVNNIGRDDGKNINEKKNFLEDISKDKNMKNETEVKNSLVYVKDCIIKIFLDEPVTKKSIKVSSNILKNNFSKFIIPRDTFFIFRYFSNELYTLLGDDRGQF